MTSASTRAFDTCIMDYLYPDRISEDDEASSCHSREIEGGISAVKSVTGVMTRDSGRNDASSDSQTEMLPENVTRYARGDDAGSNNHREKNSYTMAAMIQHERNRRLGVREDKERTHSNGKLPLDPTFPERVFGNIRGWFGGGGGGAMMANENGKQFLPLFHQPSSSVHSTRTHSSSLHGNGQDDHFPKKLQLMKHASHIDYSSSSISSVESSSGDDSSATSNISHNSDAEITPQERAREQALRYLCNSCVDSGRKIKTSSYVWGLERLDLTRKRDRLAKESQIVESEMNKDHGLTGHSREVDPISCMAETLLREFPRIQSVDAGAGVNSCFMTWEEYADIINSDSNHYFPAWNNKEAVDVYIDSLQRRLREAVDRTRSLEKRLVVLENAGDDIVSSLCEDLAEITECYYRTEARYAKKGKELQRKRRRQELRHRVKMKQIEHRVRKLEAQLIIASGNTQINEHILNRADLFEGSDISTEDSTNSEIEDDNEVFLERNLSMLRSKYEQEKQNHNSELESIRRQCEQLKLHQSVARLVMEGDDNLYEYIALLERCDLSLCHRLKDGGDVFDNRDPVVGDVISSPPPTRITRARAKLLKVFHLERIYEQRLVVSKAFTDATIKALDQELVERHALSQDMEVRCLNELAAIDAEIKDAHLKAIENLAMIETEMHELQDTISGIVQNPTANQSLLFCSHARDPLIDKLLKKDKLSSNKRLSGRDCLFGPKQSTENDPSASVVSEIGGTALVSDDPSYPLNDRVPGDWQEDHVIKSNTDFVRLSDFSLLISEKLPETNKQRISSLVKTPESIGVEKTCSSEAPDNAALKQLGCDLKFTIACYQKSHHASTSRDRLEKLDTMNDLVVKIAKLLGQKNGIDYPIGVSLTSWSFKKIRKPPLNDEYREQKRITKKKKRRNRVRDKEYGHAMKDGSKQSVQ